MGVCYIFASLACGWTPPVGPGDLVVAADAGYLRLNGVKPDLVVGDFDSLGFVPEGEGVVRHPARKDDTDTLLAVRLGLARGCRTFAILGGLGGRLDHTLANIQTLAYLSARGARGCLVGAEETALMLDGGSIRFAAGLSGAISVFAYGAPARGVTEEGLEYPLDRATLSPDYPLGVSNAFSGSPARISVEEGRLLIVWNGRPEDTDFFL
ncbi:MAG TPA: thiamine diphosphokinase [Clostridia bacterium]|nr:thiamine diphosphokinase [Clostridia bacterium]